jgi:hypothetical protein
MRVINDIIDYLRRRRLLDSDDLCSLEGKGFIESYKVDKEDWWERHEADFFYHRAEWENEPSDCDPPDASEAYGLAEELDKRQSARRTGRRGKRKRTNLRR